MKNEFVEYYQKYNISPVSQDISDLQKHCQRRARLYRILGIAPRALFGAKILEAGAGSGYNALALLLNGAQMDIVEPNEAGRQAMCELFKEYKISEKSYKIFPKFIESFALEKIGVNTQSQTNFINYENLAQISESSKYDFVLAEGFLPVFSVKNSKNY